MCPQVLGGPPSGARRPLGRISCASVKKAIPAATVQAGEVVKGVNVRVKENEGAAGRQLRSLRPQAMVLSTGRRKPRGTRIFGAVAVNCAIAALKGSSASPPRGRCHLPLAVSVREISCDAKPKRSKCFAMSIRKDDMWTSSPAETGHVRKAAHGPVCAFCTTRKRSWLTGHRVIGT